MKLFVPSSNKFDTFALFPEEGREYLIDIDKRPCVDNDTKIKCYAKCVGRDEDMITFDCGVVCGDDLTIFVKATDMHLYDKLLIQEASGSTLPYTPTLKDGKLTANPKFRFVGKAYKMIFNNENLPDIWVMGMNEITAILKDVKNNVFHFITAYHTIDISIATGTILSVISTDNNGKVFSMECDNCEIELEELK